MIKQIELQIAAEREKRASQAQDPEHHLADRAAGERGSHARPVLVLCATGKAGKNISRALKESGFDVYGTTRGNTEGLARDGVKPIVADYTVRADLDRALAESGAKRVVVITDYWSAAGRSAAREIEQGKTAFAAAKAAGVEHLVFMSVAEGEGFPPECAHIHSKVALERVLHESGLPFSVVRPSAFFENFDDAANFNPLKRGRLHFLSAGVVPFCAAYDIGRAAALQLERPSEWHGKPLDVIGWKGSLAEAAAALERVSSERVRHGLLMPVWARRLLLPDLHRMCLHFEAGGVKVTPEEFKRHVPDAMSAEDWFRSHGTYANGEPIVPTGNKSQQRGGGGGLFSTLAASALGVAVLTLTMWIGARFAGMR